MSFSREVAFHKDDIRLKNQKNSTAQHLRQKHPITKIPFSSSQFYEFYDITSQEHLTADEE